ncbi:alpha/beta fold hydrolase [Ancylobacter sp. MQZ15Z-1]|uniref:Alpha/beta fold hydrolase n=1 Tax=Ancylobacter mangrovi TaxID=2972472 RepID=A0A9X2T3L9_9HYPH|nr:alpha/beta hydrolase [Ancylobacter mangrovi]MCS0497272.1 alpha/beta fold hydrolase [Ancylobacter mangrovi]
MRHEAAFEGPDAAPDLEISLLGELRVVRLGAEVALPASRKARALLAFLVATGRPHRRERLSELFWDLPDDPRAALRWSLTKLRKVVDSPGRPRIIADRERVSFDAEGLAIDMRGVRGALRDPGADIPLSALETMAERLEQVFLDGLDGAGADDGAFDSWLTAEREDMRAARCRVLYRLATHPDMDPIPAQKWARLWREVDPEGNEARRPGPPAPHRREMAEARERPPPPALIAGPGTGLLQLPIPRSPVPRPSVPQLIERALRSQRIGFCEVGDGTKIAYAITGSGPPLLKAANWLNHLEFDWSSPIWGRGFAEIARLRTFVRYDERGCGLSNWDVDDLTFDAFVEDLEAVVDKLGLERFPLLGISQGAAVSIEYAVRHPERVSGLILIGGYAAGWRHLSSPEEQARREAVRDLTKVGWGTDNPAYRHIFSQTFMPDAGPEELAWFDEFQRRTTSAHNAARFQDAFGDIDVRDRLAKVRTPTIVLHSRYDQRVPLEVGRALASGIPDAHFVPLESRNHILVDNEPAWLTCVDAVRRFMLKMRI